MAVGATPDAVRDIYGAAAFQLDSESGSAPSWAAGQVSATVSADGDRIGLVEVLRPGQFDVMSAGSDCPLSPLAEPPEQMPPLPDVAETVIDLSRPAPELVPTVLASYRWSTSDDGIPQLVIAPAGPDEVAVLDSATGVVEFLDSQTGQVVRSEQVRMAPGTTTCCWLFFGPDDIIYVNHLENGLPDVRRLRADRRRVRRGRASTARYG